jgi:hypothetical protein
MLGLWPLWVVSQLLDRSGTPPNAPPSKLALPHFLRGFTDRNDGRIKAFAVQCTVGEDHFCIEVPTDCSVGDVLKKASEHSETKGTSLWHSDIPLTLDRPFADYFEPDGIYHVKLAGNYPEGSLMTFNETKLKRLGVNLSDPRLLMEVGTSEWSMAEFLEKARDFAPTLALIEMENGTQCGGAAGVPWPEIGEVAADPEHCSFIFSLGAAPTRFDLVD